MSQVQRPIRLVNTGQKKAKRKNSGSKHLTWKQKLHFGTKRQRAAAQARLGNKGRHKRRNGIFDLPAYNRKERKARTPAQRAYYAQKHRERTPRRNVGEIIVIKSKSPLSNSGSRKRKSNKGKRRISNNSMATKSKRKSPKRVAAGKKAARTRKRQGNAGHGVAQHRRRTYRRRRPTANAGGVRRRTYRRNTGVRHYRRHRRNAGTGSMFSGGFGQALGVIAGAIVTKFASSAVASISPTLGSGFPLYIVMAITAVAQGKLVGKLLKNPTLGRDMTTGGWVALALQLLNDFLPGLSPFSLNGMRGMGLIGPSSFYTPQVNRMGSMGSFIPPAALQQAIAAGMPVATAVGGGMKGLGSGMNQRRVGRLR